MTTTQVYQSFNLVNKTIHNDILNQDSIDWITKNNTIMENNYAVTAKPLYTISGLWMEKFLSNTSELWCTNFKIPDTGKTVLGIELFLYVQRSARIQDLKVQLTLDGVTEAGNNYASAINPVIADMNTAQNTPPQIPVGNFNIYGGPADLWGLTPTSTQLAQSTFGCVLSFKSNQLYPHRDHVYIDQVGIRVTYG